MIKGVRAIRASMERLRKIAEDRSYKDERGRTKYEGYPIPFEVELELERVYKVAYRAGLKNGRYKA